jgi:hypothetical protein
VAPELQFFNRSMSVDQPFKAKRRRGIRLEKVFAEFDARWIRADLDRVEHGRREAVTRNGERLSYDRLVSGAVGDDSTISGHALWWPPNKLAGRYLSSQVGEAADVMPQDVAGIPLETALDSDASAERPVLADISETSVSRRSA